MKPKVEEIATREYRATDRMRDIIADNTLLLSALSRFDIALGFGDSTIREVCRHTNVDTETFLAVANLMSNRSYSYKRINLSSLINYLKNAHSYFIDFVMPSIRRKLIDGLSNVEQNDVPLLILKFFDVYQDEVEKHMGYENNHVFTYVEQLLSGNGAEEYNISHFLANHKPIASKLHELKEIIICHYNGDGNKVNLINSVLFDIIMCERDLMKHCEVEDKLFAPAVMDLEKQVANGKFKTITESNSANDEALSDLTEREREIIACVARGLSNKEIADKLCLSVHTVATHRRNVCTKLEIHSTSGLTIFAILHKLIDLSEVKI